MNSGVCFVMQPFDNERFDKRFEDIFFPSLSKVGLDPYRVDKDPGVSIPVEDIERGIRDSRICFAEITTDNPNVWFELGYAIACNKDVILVCSNERTTPYPFDIRHRSIIIYDTDSVSSYNKLKHDIIARAEALLKKQERVASINPTVVETEGLSDHEITALVTIMANGFEVGDGTSGTDLKNSMYKQGYNDLAVSISLKKLLNKKMIEKSLEQDYNGYEYYSYTITNIGEEWVLKNEDKILLKTKENPQFDEDPFI